MNRLVFASRNLTFLLRKGIMQLDKLEFVGMCVMDVITHYDLLVDENNDPFRDPPSLQEYMNGWDGELFLESLELSNNKNEIGRSTRLNSSHAT